MWPNPQLLRIWSHLLKKSLIENFIFCAVILLVLDQFPLEQMDKYFIQALPVLALFLEWSGY